MRVSRHVLTTLTLDVSSQRHAPAALYPRERTASTHCTGSFVGPGVSLDTEARGKVLSPLARMEPQSLGRPARSQAL
jgi:hypothetical protein